MQNIKQKSPLMNTYARFPISVAKADGSYLTADDGTDYLDFTSGIAVCNLGHRPKLVQRAVEIQLQEYWHVSNLFQQDIQERAATSLITGTHLDQVFFCGSGAEANEAAIKLARKYWFDKGTLQKSEIVTFEQSFHGRTGGAMAATGQNKIKHGFAPLMPGFTHLPFNDKQAITNINPQVTAAVMLELIQGEGGVVPADQDWVNELVHYCRTHGILIIADEIQTGAGRTGSLYAFEQFNVKPEIVTAAKGIGSGFPAGACLASAEVAASFSPGTHGTTFGGHPAACAAVEATMGVIQEEGFLREVQDRFAIFRKQLEQLASSYRQVKQVRGSGAMIGIVVEEAAPYLQKLRNRQILALPAGPQVIRVLPPLTASAEELSTFVQVFEEILQEGEISHD
ncbi:aspartate aminotransferase family protein [Alkalicoccus luteus]|uniref:Acetylornithine/succinylornithine family transaminase n=1 Tax=Alkalicoccus luteus TaxID=1237094 RepID=A0A969TUP9_9BACI|nr:acetylornithine/succinylornithine family transaminase [Alkalicoccus luteus]NJP37297.1 acetylornithine/succinylornithine family transaminase [Alkalicoccus luteus]